MIGLVVVAIVAGTWAVWLALARAADRERVARAAHEVRGPLTAVHLALHGAARRGELSPGTLAAVELELRRAALALQDVHGPRPAAREPIDVAALVAVQVRCWDAVARAAGGSVRLSGGDGGAVVHGDAVRLAQALGNVLANAIEHGGGAIEVRLAPRRDAIRIEVADDGPGLPEPVAKLCRGPRSGRGRRGRGLAIADGVLRAHGGRLGAAPAVRGACVALELPAATPASRSARPAAAAPPPAVRLGHPA